MRMAEKAEIRITQAEADPVEERMVKDAEDVKNDHSEDENAITFII